ncbi:MAG: hypothetical protein CMH57_10185 [Myxococcales bacterium]|nr:hypothetical protein [Myxococcales bacterium]
MTDAQTSQRGSPWVGRLAVVAVVGVAAGVALTLAVNAGEARLNEALKAVRYQARILSATPDAACVRWVQGSGGRLLGSLIEIARSLPFPIHNLPQPSDSPEPSGEADEAGDEVFDPECNVTVLMEVAVHNPLPVGSHARILGVQARVASQRLEPDQVEFASSELDAAADAPWTAQVTLRLRIEQILAGASQIVLRRKLPIEASVQAEVSALGGLMARQLSLPLKRELTERELRQGAIEGTLAAQE